MLYLKTKKWFIEHLRAAGFRANYSNITWFYQDNFKIVGGVLFFPHHQHLYFCIADNYDDVIINCSYLDDLEPLINGIKRIGD